MPPEIEAFFNAFGRMPRPGFQGEMELNAFRVSPQGRQALAQIGGGPPGPIFGDQGFDQGPGLGGDFTIPLNSQRTFQPGLQPGFPDAARRRGGGGPLPDGPGPLFSPEAGTPGGAPLAAAGVGGGPADPTLASSITGILGQLDGFQRSTPDTEVARARLGGGAGGFSFPRGGTGAPGQASAAPALQGGPQFGGLPGVGPTGGGEALNQLGLQQQADVMQQRQLAADTLGSLLGGIGGIAGGLGGGGGGGAGAPAAATASAPAAGSFQNRLNRASQLRASGLGRV